MERVALEIICRFIAATSMEVSDKRPPNREWMPISAISVWRRWRKVRPGSPDMVSEPGRLVPPSTRR